MLETAQSNEKNASFQRYLPQNLEKELRQEESFG